MKTSPFSQSIFALPLDVQREAMALRGIPVAAVNPSSPRGAVKPTWRESVSRALIALLLMLSAVGIGHLLTRTVYDGELLTSTDKLDRAEAEIGRLRRQVAAPPPAAPAVSAASLLPALPSIAAGIPVPAAPPAVEQALPVKKIEIAAEDPKKSIEKEAAKVAMVSIPAAELQAAIRRARAAGPKPATKPSPLEKAADKPKSVTAANWQDLPIEFIPADRSIVASVNANGIALKNGVAVAVGGLLSASGERILAVDPPNTIITNRRILSITRY